VPAEDDDVASSEISPSLLRALWSARVGCLNG
jgi:hypothetical protein